MSVVLPDPLLRAVRERKCLLFVGSGISSLAGYPTWGQLIERLVAEARQVPFARTEGLEQIEEQRDYFMLAEFARATLAPSQYTQLLKEELDRPVPPTAVHNLIAATDYRGIITTNYDRLLETTVTQVRGWMPSTFTSESVSAMGAALYSPDFFIFKLHGDLLSPVRGPHVRSFLHAVFLNYTVLFVGYSLRDPDFNLILRELTLVFENHVPAHYALLPGAGAFAADHLLRQMNIQVISYDPADNHAAVGEVLQTLHDLAPAEAAVGA